MKPFMPRPLLSRLEPSIFKFYTGSGFRLVRVSGPGLGSKLRAHRWLIPLRQYRQLHPMHGFFAELLDFLRTHVHRACFIG